MAKNVEVIEVTWEVEDGYVGNRPQYLGLYEDEFDEGMTDEDIMDRIEAAVREEFMANIGWRFTDEQELKEAVEKIKAAIAARGDEE